MHTKLFVFIILTIMITSCASGNNQNSIRQNPLLLFEIDEGFPDSMLGKYKDNISELNKRLGNIYNSLSELTSKYDVAVLIYPTHLYDRNAYGKAEESPIDRIHPALKHTFDFFKYRNTDKCRITIFLEAYSSGIATNQDGNLSNKPPAPVKNSPDDKGRLGWAMDVDAIAALKDTYPNLFKGIRFHEVYGSDVAWKVRPEGNKHGFVMDEEVVRAAIDVCHDKKLVLLWSDSNWLVKCPAESGHPIFVYDEINKPYSMSEPYASLQDYAEKRLGSNVCFSWANNNYHTTQNLEFLDSVIKESKPGIERPLPNWFYFSMPFKEFPLKGRPEAKWGMSVQSWFWHELTNVLNARYYLLGENNCPVEIMQSYVLKGIKEGASILQFEPSWYFFNQTMGYYWMHPSTYERSDNNSERMVFKRLKQVLMDPDNPNNPPADLSLIFDCDQQRFHENCASNPPKNYSQSTLNILKRSDGKTVNASFDFYSSGRRWMRQDEYRYGEWVFDGDVIDIQRIELQGDAVDDILVLKRDKDGKLFIEAYDTNSGLIGTDTELTAPDKDGEFFGMVTANIIPETVGQGDPDEIIVLRKPRSGDILNPRVYKAGLRPDRMVSFEYTPLPDDENISVLQKYLDPSMLRVDGFIDIIGIRTAGILYEGFTRSLDKIAIIRQNSNGTSANTISDGKLITGRIKGEFFTAADINHDFADELLAAKKDSKGISVIIYRITADGFRQIENRRIIDDSIISGKPIAFTSRKTIYLNGGKKPGS